MFGIPGSETAATPPGMQGLESIAGSVRAAHLLGVGGGGGGGGGVAVAVGDRRLRPQQHQSLKCPRCDSLNTKFCYYNNYNLSQPRHFCKSCRRYWTKGGVLRNVPVGGGSRKSKRADRGGAAATSGRSPRRSSKEHRRRATSAASGSSSDSSTLTAGTAAEASPPARNQTGGSVAAESIDRGEPTVSPPTSTAAGAAAAAEEIFHDSDARILAGLVESRGFLSCNFADTISFHQVSPAQQYHHRQQVADGGNGSLAEEVKLQEEDFTTPASFMEHVAPADLPPLQSNRIETTGGLAGLEWPGCYDPTVGIFDLPGGTIGGGADNGVFWNQNQWAEADPSSLYLLSSHDYSSLP